jgi:hypothetical protein
MLTPNNSIRTDFVKFEPSNSDWALWDDAQEIARRARTLASVGVYRNKIFNLAGDASTTPEALYGLRVSANLFPTLGVTPMLGATFFRMKTAEGSAR